MGLDWGGSKTGHSRTADESSYDALYFERDFQSRKSLL